MVADDEGQEHVAEGGGAGVAREEGGEAGVFAQRGERVEAQAEGEGGEEGVDCR